MKLSLLLTVMHTLDDLRSHERWTRREIEKHQAVALRQLRNYAYAHSPFYQQFHRGLTERPLNELPILTKAMMMEHFDEFVTDRSIRLDAVRSHAANDKAGERFLDRYWVTATSGSSGHPGFFLFNPQEWAFVMASFARGQEWSGLKLSLTQRTRMATVASLSPWHMSSQVAATAKSWWRPSLRLSASQSLSLTGQHLDKFQPTVLIAYASMAGILAEEQRAGRLHIHPELVYTSSEVLSPLTRQRVCEVWGNEPFNQYGATETADIAAEYKTCRRMHLFEDLLSIEIVDELNRPVPRGEYGAKVLVSTLFSRTQPLIRYELDDIVRISAEPHDCDLGFAVLESVQGRTEVELQLPAMTGGTMKVQPLVFARVMDIVPVSGWQIAQQADNGLLVLVAGAQADLTDEMLLANLHRSLAQEGARVPDMRVKHVARIPQTGAGKTPLVKAYSLIQH